MKLKIDKLVFGGQALGRHEGKVVLVWGALPGEIVEVELTKEKKNFAEGRVLSVIEASPDRIDSKEDHYEICSPWQYMTMESEDKWKNAIAQEMYARLTGNDDQEVGYIGGEVDFGYRNKMEYAFTGGKGALKIAFSTRGGKELVPNDGCALGSDAINDAAQFVLDWLNDFKWPAHKLKSLILRSNLKGEVVAALFMKEKVKDLEMPELNGDFLGLHVFYSDPKSPISVPTALMESIGQDTLAENVLDMKLSYGLLSFFQIHVPIFEHALRDIAKFVGGGDEVVDYYAGVGAISLPLHHTFKSAVLVENNEEAVGLAKANIAENEIVNCTAECMPAERMTEVITKDKVVILDPPRAGLHDKVLMAIRREKPKRVIYLSCNLSTQVRDVGLLMQEYKVVFSKAYNFFPRTPHIEGLLVLDRV